MTAGVLVDDEEVTMSDMVTSSSDIPGDTLLERRKRATQRDIATAAIELFEEIGYDATTVELIAQRAGISNRTFYRYCSGKDDVLSSNLQISAAGMASAVRNASSGSLAERVAQAFSFWADIDPSKHVNLRRSVLLALAVPDLRVRWLASGRDGQALLTSVLEDLAPGLSAIQASALAGAIVSALTVATESWALGQVADLGTASREALSVLDPVLSRL